MKTGFVSWDDSDPDGVNKKNFNDKNGTLPDGVYNSNTRIEFCCRTDGNKNDAIVLTSEKPFFLLAYESPKCQMVKWATVRPDILRYRGP